MVNEHFPQKIPAELAHIGNFNPNSLNFVGGRRHWSCASGIMTLKQNRTIGEKKMDNDALKQMFDMHIKECEGRDARNMKAVDEIKGMFKGIWDAQDDMRRAVTNLQIRGALAMGGLIVIGKLLDYYFAWMHK